MSELVVEKGKFKWFYLKNKKGEYVACVATGHAKDGDLIFNYSVLNKDKDEWSRKVARDVAIGRIVAGRGQPINLPTVPPNRTVKELILLALKQDRYTPSRLKEAAKFWLSEGQAKRREAKKHKPVVTVTGQLSRKIGEV